MNSDGSRVPIITYIIFLLFLVQKVLASGASSMRPPATGFAARDVIEQKQRGGNPHFSRSPDCSSVEVPVALASTFSVADHGDVSRQSREASEWCSRLTVMSLESPADHGARAVHPESRVHGGSAFSSHAHFTAQSHAQPQPSVPARDETYGVCIEIACMPLGNPPAPIAFPQQVMN